MVNIGIIFNSIEENSLSYTKAYLGIRILFFLDNPKIGGIFNAGTGVVRTWNDLAKSVFKAMDRKISIEYIDMPPSIRDQFQYRTCAKIDKIRKAGYSQPITSLEEATTDYIQNYLIFNKRLGESKVSFG